MPGKRFLVVLFLIDGRSWGVSFGAFADRAAAEARAAEYGRGYGVVEITA